MRLRPEQSGDIERPSDPGSRNAVLVFQISRGLRIRLPINLIQPWLIADFTSDDDLCLFLYYHLYGQGRIEQDEAVLEMATNAVDRLVRAGRLLSRDAALAHATGRAATKGLVGARTGKTARSKES